MEPLQDAKDKGLAQASRPRLYIFYFSDPRSHSVYRKSQYYQGGMRCCLMACLLKVLSDMLQNPQLPSHIHIWPKPKVQLGPTDSFYPEPPSSVDIATAKTLINSVSPMGSRSQRDGLANSLLPIAIFFLLEGTWIVHVLNDIARDGSHGHGRPFLKSESEPIPGWFS